MKEILLSIVIPVLIFKILNKALSSCYLEKEKHLYEIICIDDGSQDKSPTILNKYSKIFSNLKIFKNYKNLGVGRSRNIGIENSNGKFIIF